jgi:hypothetical protein
MDIWQGVHAVLPLTTHKRILFICCPHFQDKNKVQINNELPYVQYN